MSRDVHKEAHQIIDDDSIYVPPLNYDSSDRAMNILVIYHTPLSTISHLFKRWWGRRDLYLIYFRFSKHVWKRMMMKSNADE